MENLIGTIASALTILSFLPQVVKIWRTRNVEAISLRMYALLTSATALWTWFGIVIQSPPVIATNAICLGLQSSILILKLQHQTSSN